MSEKFETDQWGGQLKEAHIEGASVLKEAHSWLEELCLPGRKLPTD